MRRLASHSLRWRSQHLEVKKHKRDGRQQPARVRSGSVRTKNCLAYSGEIAAMRQSERALPGRQSVRFAAFSFPLSFDGPVEMLTRWPSFSMAFFFFFEEPHVVALVAWRRCPNPLAGLMNTWVTAPLWEHSAPCHHPAPGRGLAGLAHNLYTFSTLSWFVLTCHPNYLSIPSQV